MVALAKETVPGDWWTKVTFGTLRCAYGCPARAVTGDWWTKVTFGTPRYADVCPCPARAVTVDRWTKVTFGTLRYADGCPARVVSHTGLECQGNLWNTKVRIWLPSEGSNAYLIG